MEHHKMLILGNSSKGFLCIISFNLLNKKACVIIYPTCQAGEWLHSS